MKNNHFKNLTDSLVFKRIALKAKDGKDGFLYVHSWATGFQELIFSSHKQAGTFLK